MQGAYFLCTKELYLKLGGINEIFEPYILEETDFMYKVLKSGYKIAYAHDTKCLHLNGGTIQSKTSKKTRYLSIRNRHIFTLIHIHSPCLLFQYFIMLPIRLFSSIERRALKEIFSMRKEIMKARKEEIKRSTVKDMTILLNAKKYEREIKGK